MKLSMKNSIYQSGYSGGGPGLTVRGGRLINNRPDSEMGIVSAANARKEMKRQSKIQMQAEGYARGEQMSEMNNMMRGLDSHCG
jgi:hypothetical protein